MNYIQVVTDPAECRRVWERAIPPDTIYDLWDIRECFHRQFNRPFYFIVAERGNRISGLLPMVWIEESRCYGFFPGETWMGKTWLEQNRIIATSHSLLTKMMARVNGYGPDIHLRYLLPSKAIKTSDGTIDERGYLFYPGEFSYNMDNYFRLFSHKSIKRILRDVGAIENRGLEYQYDNLDDIETMIRFNIERYGNASYFSDRRFADSFRELALLLYNRGWLRLTTLLIEGKPAAIDLGSVYNGAYTLLAGGTNADFPGIAKVINLHHMKWACEQRLGQVDFLCGEFSWKPMFHLTPRPLYVLTNMVPKEYSQGSTRAEVPALSAELPGFEGVMAHA
jgi:hypothetical protein